MNIVRCSKNAHAIGALQVKKNQTKQNNMRDLFKYNKGTLSCFDLKLNQEIVRVSFASVPHYDFTHHTADIYYDVCTFIKLCSCIAHCLMINLSKCVNSYRTDLCLYIRSVLQQNNNIFLRMSGFP